MSNLLQRAQQLCSQAFQAQMQGELERAVELYTQSITVMPTAEAYTFRGWTYSFQGEYEKAIEECLRAIELDPDFANPYNDIGAYLIETGRLDDAMPWLKLSLQKTTGASREASPCFPLFNLGRVYERKRLLQLARQQYQKALASNPAYEPAHRALARIRTQRN